MREDDWQYVSLIVKESESAHAARMQRTRLRTLRKQKVSVEERAKLTPTVACGWPRPLTPTHASAENLLVIASEPHDLITTFARPRHTAARTQSDIYNRCLSSHNPRARGSLQAPAAAEEHVNSRAPFALSNNGLGTCACGSDTALRSSAGGAGRAADPRADARASRRKCEPRYALGAAQSGSSERFGAGQKMSHLFAAVELLATPGARAAATTRNRDFGVN